MTFRDALHRADVAADHERAFRIAGVRVDGEAGCLALCNATQGHGEIVGRNLFGDRVAYTPIVFYNSSKFFEVEYTTVGQVMSLPDGTPTIYRKMPGKMISQRIVHDGQRVLGLVTSLTT